MNETPALTEEQAVKVAAFGLDKSPELTAVLELHSVEHRYQSSPDEETSFDSAEECAEYHGIPIESVSFFDVCAECGRIEMVGEDENDWDELYFNESLWPCLTIRKIQAAS